MDQQTNTQQDMNQVILVGTLPRDPIFKQVGANATPLLSFTVMTTRKWIDPSTTEPRSQTQYNNVTAWRNLADSMSHQLKMGTRVKVVGELQSRSWDNPTTGKKEYKTDVNALQITVVGDASEDIHPSLKPSKNNDSTDSVNPDDLPF